MAHTPTSPFPQDPVFDGVEALLGATDSTGFPVDDFWLYAPEPGDEDYEAADFDPPEPEPSDPDFGDMEAGRYERAMDARAQRY